MELERTGLVADLYVAYRSNLEAVDPDRAPADSILCPLCLHVIARAEVEGAGFPLEHIIPQHSTRESVQPSALTKVGTRNARSGLTITCRACNAEKGRRLDWAMRNRITPSKRSADDYGFSSGVAIVTYAYLLAFAHFGYEYILKEDLAEIRLQFAHPRSRRTTWLQHATVDLAERFGPIVCTEMGYPCVFRLQPPPLQVIFWRFVAHLPGLNGLKTAVDVPSSLRQLADAANREPSTEPTP